MSSSIIQLECQCNNYPWGKKGSSSLAKEYAEVGYFYFTTDNFVHGIFNLPPGDKFKNP
jgi:hypothetical protein